MPQSKINISAAFLKHAHIVEKMWGGEAWLENNTKYCVKLLELKPGFQSSLHFHNYKDETFIVLSGAVILELAKPVQLAGDNKVTQKRMCVGDKHRLFPGIPHRFYAEDGQAEESLVLEVSTTHDDSDVVRLEESKVRDVPAPIGLPDTPKAP